MSPSLDLAAAWSFTIFLGENIINRRLSDSSRVSSLSHKMSRLALSIYSEELPIPDHED